MSEELLCALNRYIGRTVTIFTTSGGLSGSGFTGVLAYVGPTAIKLITDIGAAPSCPLGNGSGGSGYGYADYSAYRMLGSITEIPICNIASFTHSAI